MGGSNAGRRLSLPEWLSINPWAIVLIVVALVLGVFMGAQHSRLPELANVIIGPAVGSFLAVGAGAWLANWQERRKRTEAKFFVVPILEGIVQSLEVAINGFASYEALLQKHRDKERAPTEGRVSATMSLARLASEVEKFDRRLHQLQSAFSSMGYQGSVLYADALEILQRIQSRLASHSENMGEMDADISERTVGNLIDLWRWADSTKETALTGRYVPSLRPLPEVLRNDPRWATE